MMSRTSDNDTDAAMSKAKTDINTANNENDGNNTSTSNTIMIKYCTQTRRFTRTAGGSRRMRLVAAPSSTISVHDFSPPSLFSEPCLEGMFRSP